MRKLLFPIVPIYYLVTWWRNAFYDFNIKPSKSYDLPIICVGNLSVGGTGKSPMIEYLIRLLGKDYSLATLSRGYKRSTRGFIIADDKVNALSIGDEPYQFYRKFKNIIVSVDEDRQNGIESLLKLSKIPEIILLDDAYQHRKVKAGFNVLLTSYSDLYVNDIMLPTGDLREPISGAKRANVIVVTKCPKDISEVEKMEINSKLKTLNHQTVFFSSIKYSETIKNTKEDKDLDFFKDKKLTVVTGIANPTPFIEYLKNGGLEFNHVKFTDHHQFSDTEMDDLNKKEWLLTTEKDYVRLEPYFKDSNKLFYLPIEIDIDKPETFNKEITSFIKTF